MAGVEVTTLIATKWCERCRTDKPFAEFYEQRNTKDGHWHICKTCKQAQQRKYKTHSKTYSPNCAENLAVAKLESLGMPAAPGKASSFTGLMDVVAWNCVTIQVKSGSWKPEKRSYVFNFNSQAYNGIIKESLVLLIPIKMTVLFPIIFSCPAIRPSIYPMGK